MSEEKVMNKNVHYVNTNNYKLESLVLRMLTLTKSQ